MIMMKFSNNNKDDHRRINTHTVIWFTIFFIWHLFKINNQNINHTKKNKRIFSTVSMVHSFKNLHNDDIENLERKKTFSDHAVVVDTNVVVLRQQINH